MKMRPTCLLLLGALCSVPLFAQEQKPEEDLYELSLEQLMNVPINSASKKDETLFDAPLSSYTITRQEIDKAGSTSIMEALRLHPVLLYANRQMVYMTFTFVDLIMHFAILHNLSADPILLHW